MDGHYDIVSSIFIAKSILSEHKHLLTSLQYDRQWLGHEKYNFQDRVKLHTCITSLIPIIVRLIKKEKGFTNFRIKVLKFDGSDPSDPDCKGLAGVVIKESVEEYVIFINEKESYCTQRLALCKELCQIYVDVVIEDEPATQGPSNQLLVATRELINKFYPLNNAPILTNRFNSSEVFAKSMAIELMIPYQVREEIELEIGKGTDTEVLSKRLFITTETLQDYIQKYFHFTTPIYSFIGDPK